MTFIYPYLLGRGRALSPNNDHCDASISQVLSKNDLHFYSLDFVHVMSPNLINPLLNPCNINSMA